KMSKSKGNVVTPMALLDEYSSDAVRYWAASGRPGTDTAFDVGQMKIGRRLAIKILNASKFVLMHEPREDDAAITEPLDQALLAYLGEVVEQATAAFEDYNYAKALELAEAFFWNFTDDYVELVKERAYGGQGPQRAASAQATLARTLRTLLALFAPFLPFVTEEVWSWWQPGSVHRTPWPQAQDLRSLGAGADVALIGEVATVLTAVRKAKSEVSASMKAEIAVCTVTAAPETVTRLATAIEDIKAAGRIREFALVEGGGTLSVTATLA
ncbi:MAG: valine--tRNA ligase, partial [Caulobacteraceae bacterium]|nr:valine--tRNA ligase [Caulobacteraceae bacterium]